MQSRPESHIPFYVLEYYQNIIILSLFELEGVVPC